MKKEIRVLGVDDGPFHKHNDKNCLIVGVLFRGGKYIDGVMSTEISVDGTDSAENIARMINLSKFKKHLRAIFLNGVTFGGFNVVDAVKLNNETNIPVIIVVRKYPNYKTIFAALKKIHKEEKIRLIEQLSVPEKVGKVYIQPVGISFEDAISVVKISTSHADIPECLRVAHLIAGGIVSGESRGRA